MKTKQIISVFFNTLLVIIIGGIVSIILGAYATAESYHQCFYD